MSSALELILAGVVAQIATVPGVTSAKAVPASQLFDKPAKEGMDVRVATLPPSYPGAVVSVNEDEIHVEDVRQSGSTSVVLYRVAVYAAIYATSDGTVEAAAQKLVWQIGQAVDLAMMIFVPYVPNVATRQLEPAGFEPIVVDPTMYGLLMKWWARYQLVSSIS